MADQVQIALLEPPPTRELSFTVLGHPMPGGSKKGFLNPKTNRVVIVEDSKNKPWRAAVAAAGISARPEWGDSLSTQPLHVEFTFYRARPLSHYGAGRNAETLKPNAPAHPTTRPDVLKLARAAEDSLTGVLYVDDAQIVYEILHKRWGTPERVEITIREL
jgi:Holliday junction resolvase RusA-like endonuclease